MYCYASVVIVIEQVYIRRLLPFKNAIISDGLVSVIPIIFGPNSKADFKEIYMDAKRNGEIKARI